MQLKSCHFFSERGGRGRIGLNLSGLLALEYKVQQQKQERSCFNMVEGKKQCERCPLLPTHVQWYACIDLILYRHTQIILFFNLALPEAR